MSQDIDLGVRIYGEHKADAIVAVGGGSGLDAGKCISMAVASGGSVPLKHFEKGGTYRLVFSMETRNDYFWVHLLYNYQRF